MADARINESNNIKEDIHEGWYEMNSQIYLISNHTNLEEINLDNWKEQSEQMNLWPMEDIVLNLRRMVYLACQWKPSEDNQANTEAILLILIHNEKWQNYFKTKNESIQHFKNKVDEKYKEYQAYKKNQNEQMFPEEKVSLQSCSEEHNKIAEKQLDKSDEVIISSSHLSPLPSFAGRVGTFFRQPCHVVTAVAVLATTAIVLSLGS